MDSWHSYSKIYNIGHPYTDLLFDGENVAVEEKVDGSQFSFGLFDGKLLVRSKGRVFDVHGPDNLFIEACASVLERERFLREGYCYRGEYLRKPKHNVLAYGRVPKGNIIIFDIGIGDNRYLTPEEKRFEAERIGLETVPVLWNGPINHSNELTELLNKTSVLGGQKIEGFVVKNYDRFTRDGKVMMGKYVSEAFKEIHRPDFRKQNPPARDILDQLARTYKSEARWQKAVQHLAEAGELQNAPQDIGNLIREVQRDISEECREEIKEVLFNWAWRTLKDRVNRGLPEWYKMKLLEGAFGE